MLVPGGSGSTLIAAKMNSSPPQARDVKLRREFGEGQPFGPGLVDDLREPLRQRQRLRRSVGFGDPRSRASRVRPTAALALREDRRAELARPRGAVGEDAVELGGIAAKFVEPRADRRDQRDQRIGKRGLERAEALAGEMRASTCSTLSPVTARVDADQVLRFGPPSSAAGIVGQGLGIGLRLADLLRDRRRRCR